MSRWEMVRLGDVCHINMGQSPDSSTYNQDKVGIPFYQGNADFGELNPITRYWCSGPTKIANPNDILFSVRAPIGAINVATERCCIGRGLAALTAMEQLCSLYYLRYTLYAKCDSIIEQGTGSTFKAINKAVLTETVIPLPPLAEQLKIAAELDKISALIAKRRSQIEKLDLLVKSKFVEMFGDPVTNPMGWRKVKLEKYYKVTSSKRVYQNELTTTGVPFYKISDLIDKVENIPCTNFTFISEALYQDYMRRNLVPKENDILITSRGTLGKCYIIKKEERFYFQDGMISWLIEKGMDINRAFFVFLFSTTDIKNQIASDSTGATVNYLSIEKIRKLDLLSPPLPLQTQFAGFVQKTEQTKTAMQKGLAGLETLYKSRMQECFE